MTITLLNAIEKVLMFMMVSISSIFNMFNVIKFDARIDNLDKYKNASVTNQVINYDTQIQYNSKIPIGITNILVEGKTGLMYFSEETEEYRTLIYPVNQVIEVGTGKAGEYVGIVTGYGPDCKTCDGRGYVACPTQTGKWTNLITDGIYYHDEKYGDLQILAADHRAFPCGTVIEVSNNDLSEPILGVVLDTGYAMRKAHENGYVHIDVAFETEVGLRFNTNKNTKFSVKRWGW